MKTNLSHLMNLAAEEEKALLDNFKSVKSFSHNTIIKELTGTETVIEDYKEAFDENFSQVQERVQKIIKYKNIILEKNNSLKLSSGKTIQEAICENKYLRHERSLLETLLGYNESTTRETEVNNSYFEINKLNFDKKEIQERYKELTEIIQNNDFEISKLNSIEFEVD